MEAVLPGEPETQGSGAVTGAGEPSPYSLAGIKARLWELSCFKPWVTGDHPQAGVWHEGFCLAPQASPDVLRALCLPLPGKLPLSVGLRTELLRVLHKSVWAFILPRGFLPGDLCLGPQTAVCVSPLG